jgi:DNA mismatch repair protein MutL
MTPRRIAGLERHATSVAARRRPDGCALGTRRGLPSIASVSRLLLETRHESRESGTAVEISGARLAGVKEIARSRGTTLTVRDLFFNVPARKKFLRSDSTELGHIVNFVTQYALAHPEGRLFCAVPALRCSTRSPCLSRGNGCFRLGGALLKQLVEVQNEVLVFYTGDDGAGEPGEHSDSIRVHGFVSKPEVHKLNRNSLYFFVNRRMVRDRIILHALNEAYRNILPAGIFPVVLLFIEMPLCEVDVNVHPSKTEVRFRHQALLHDFLRDSVRKR